MGWVGSFLRELLFPGFLEARAGFVVVDAEAVVGDPKIVSDTAMA